MGGALRAVQRIRFAYASLHYPETRTERPEPAIWACGSFTPTALHPGVWPSAGGVADQHQHHGNLDHRRPPTSARRPSLPYAAVATRRDIVVATSRPVMITTCSLADSRTRLRASVSSRPKIAFINPKTGNG